MPSFLRDLRRKSKSFRNDHKPSSNNASSAANAPATSSAPPPVPASAATANIPRNKSSSTVNSTYDNSNSSGSKPPSDRGSHPNLRNSVINGTPTPPLPVRPAVNTKRYSINVSDAVQLGLVL